MRDAKSRDEDTVSNSIKEISSQIDELEARELEMLESLQATRAELDRHEKLSRVGSQGKLSASSGGFHSSHKGKTNKSNILSLS